MEEIHTCRCHHELFDLLIEGIADEKSVNQLMDCPFFDMHAKVGPLMNRTLLESACCLFKSNPLTCELLLKDMKSFEAPRPIYHFLLNHGVVFYGLERKLLKLVAKYRPWELNMPYMGHDLENGPLACLSPAYNICLYYGEAPIHFAVRQSERFHFQLLLEEPLLNVNQLNYEGRSALEIAIEFGLGENVQILLKDSRLDLKRVNRDEQSILGVALNEVRGSRKHGSAALIVDMLLGDLRIDINQNRPFLKTKKKYRHKDWQDWLKQTPGDLALNSPSFRFLYISSLLCNEQMEKRLSSAIWNIIFSMGRFIEEEVFLEFGM